MATFGSAETIVRRDILNDYVEPYRWTVFQMMRALNDAVLDTVKINAMAGYSQSTGERIADTDLNTSFIADNCQDNVSSQGQHEQDGTLPGQMRSLEIPIDDLWLNAVCYLAAAKLIELDASDTINQNLMAQYLAKGREYAQL